MATSSIELKAMRTAGRRRSSARPSARPVDYPSPPQSVYIPPSKDVVPLPSLPASATTSAAPSRYPSAADLQVFVDDADDEEAAVRGSNDTPREKESGRSSPELFNLSTTDGTDAEAAAQALAPPDYGYGAWSFLIAGTVVEMLVWGLPWSVGVLHEYWAREMFPGEESTLTLAATLQTGLMYMTAAIGP